MSLEKPPGYLPPPRAPARDAARTSLVFLTHILPYFARLATHRWIPRPSSAHATGLAAIGAAFRTTLVELGVELTVDYAERVPQEGGLLLMWNQESHLDHLVLGAAIPRPFLSLYNNEVARIPFYGEHMRRTGHLHIDRNDEQQWRASVARAAERIREGACVLVSPEGTRSWDGRLLPMKRGAFLLATSAERPIVCVTLIGGHARMPRGSAVVRPGPLRVVFSQPIPTSGYGADDTPLRSIVARTFEQAKASGL
jgi:1-acyl-sn-glycerol-3-phosphate acyltransferase